MMRDVGDLSLEIVWISWFILLNFAIIFTDDVVLVTVGVGVGQAIVSACFTIFFHVHAVVTIVTGEGVKGQVSVGFC
jgi:hypothetical protein